MTARNGQSSEILCGCAELTRASYQEFIAAHPAMGFEQVLRETGAGQTCTACLLDLEHHYVRAVHDAARQAPADGGFVTWKPRPASLKQRVYAFVDRLAPQVPRRFRDVAPVLYGNGITEWLWVSNHSMMFEREIVAPAFRLEIVLRNRKGVVVARNRRIVAPGECLREDLSAPLAAADPEAAKGLQVGWLELNRRSAAPGLRGTTRPQFEIEAPAGTCAVHTQAATPPISSGLTLQLRPDDDRAFLTVLNVEARPLCFRLRIDTGTVASVERVITVAAGGVELVELTPPEGAAVGQAGTLANVSWTADRTHKVHMLFASRELDQFSVDHA